MNHTTSFRVTRISPLKTARILAVMWCVAAVPYAFFAQIPGWLPAAYYPWGSMVVLPVAYGLFGFVATLVGVALYNLVARWLGGIEYTVRMPAQN